MATEVFGGTLYEIGGDLGEEKRNKIYVDEENVFHSVEEYCIEKHFGRKILDFAAFIKYISGGEPSDVKVYVSIEESLQPSSHPSFYNELLYLEQRFSDTNINFQVIDVPGKRVEGGSVADHWMIRDAAKMLSNPTTLREINTFTVVSSDWIFHPLILADAVRVGLEAKAIVRKANFSEQRTTILEIPELEYIKIEYLNDILRNNPKLLQKS